MAAGSIYSLVALSYLLVYRTTNILNFAQGNMGMISVYIVFTFLVNVGLPVWLSVIFSLFFAILLGLAIYRGLVRPMHSAPLFSVVIMTFGVSQVLSGVAGGVWTFEPRSLVIIPPTTFSIGEIVISNVSIWTFVITAIIAGALFAILKYTKAGTAIRATCENKLAASLMGINVDRVAAQSWAVSSMIGLIAALVLSQVLLLDPGMMFPALLASFSAAVLGGFGSMEGAVVAGLLIGVVENLLGYYVSSVWKPVFPFVILIIVLLVKPSGLFRVEETKRV
jgi:branched-chain amino acid transport system permease protein